MHGCITLVIYSMKIYETHELNVYDYDSSLKITACTDTNRHTFTIHYRKQCRFSLILHDFTSTDFSTCHRLLLTYWSCCCESGPRWASLCTLPCNPPHPSASSARPFLHTLCNLLHPATLLRLCIICFRPLCPSCPALPSPTALRPLVAASQHLHRAP